MRRLSLGDLSTPEGLEAALREVEAASHDENITDIAQPYQTTGTATPTRQLNVTTPTLANAVAVLATLLDDLRRGGTNRST